MDIDPNVKVFIAALRAGKGVGQAGVEYCWAKSAVPVREEDSRASLVLWSLMSTAMGGDAFDEGSGDQIIARAFNDGTAIDNARGVVWRAMRTGEHPSHGELLRAMSADGRIKAAALFGIADVARAIVGAGAHATRTGE